MLQSARLFQIDVQRIVVQFVLQLVLCILAWRDFEVKVSRNRLDRAAP